VEEKRYVDDDRRRCADANCHGAREETNDGHRRLLYGEFVFVDETLSVLTTTCPYGDHSPWIEGLVNVNGADFVDSMPKAQIYIVLVAVADVVATVRGVEDPVERNSFVVRQLITRRSGIRR